MVRIWEKESKTEHLPPRLPVILTIVLSQNAESWAVNPQFASLFELPDPVPAELVSFIPDFAFQHLQLAEMHFDAIPGTPAGILALRVMKAERLGRLLDDAVWEEHLIVQVPAALFQLVLRYILAADVDRAEFEAKILSLSDIETRHAAMTLAQRYRQDGIEVGRQEGRQEALQESVLNVLAARFHRLPDGLREAVLTVRNESQLRALLNAAIECASMEAFSEAL
jgi:hypothetical protein